MCVCVCVCVCLCVCVCACVSDLSVHCVCTCSDSVYVFNHRAILAEWFKGTDSKNDALVFGKLIHAGWCPAQSNITSPGCRSAGVEFIPIVAETLGGLAEDTIHIIWSFGEAIAQRVGPQDSMLPAPNICSTVLLLPCGGGIPPFGCIAFQPSPPQWTVYCSVCVCVCVCVCA